MDKTDVILSLILLGNSRVSYRELANKLGLSVNAVHKRIQSLIDAGIIRKFTAKISLSVLQSVVVMIFGKSDAESVGNLHEKLRQQGSIYWVALAGGNHLYIGAYLKSISDLGLLVDYIKKQAVMPNPTVAILHTPLGNPPKPGGLDQTLYPLDRQIIYSLHDNSRKPVADIADELGVSTKTVRRRLSAMIEKTLIDLSMEWYPDASNDIITVIHIRLKPAANKNTVDKALKGYFPNMLFYWSLSNLPNELLSLWWTSTIKELRDVQQWLASEETIASTVSNILYTGYIFETWRDELVSPKNSETKESRSK